jgi:hypothetical protein
MNVLAAPGAAAAAAGSRWKRPALGARPGLGARLALALLICGVGLLNAASAPWARSEL